MSAKLFKNFIKKANNTFNVMNDGNFSELESVINDLSESLDDIKRYTSHMDNNSDIGANIVICELILELLNVTLKMYIELQTNDSIAKKRTKLREIKHSALQIQEKLMGATNNSYGDTVKEGVDLIFSNVERINDLYSNFLKSAETNILSRVNVGNRELRNELQDARRILEGLMSTLGKLSSGGGKKTRRSKNKKYRKTRKNKKLFFGLF